MTVVSSKEFVANQEKYFGMAVTEDIGIKRGKNMFHLIMCRPDRTTVKEPIYFEPDEDFYKSITMDEFIDKAMVRLEKIDKMYAKK